MAYPFGGHPKLADVIRRLKELDCEIRELSGEIVGPKGPQKVMYAYNPSNECFVIIQNIPEEEYLVPTMVNHIERRLGIELGFASLPGRPESGTEE